MASSLRQNGFKAHRVFDSHDDDDDDAATPEATSSAALHFSASKKHTPNLSKFQPPPPRDQSPKVPMDFVMSPQLPVKPLMVPSIDLGSVEDFGVPLSAASGSEYPPKISVPLLNQDLTWLPSGLVYDVRLLAHAPLSREDSDHPESPQRIRWIYEALKQQGYLPQFKRIKARLASIEEVRTFHTKPYVDFILKSELYDLDQLVAVARRFNSIYLNASSSFCALLSCGGLLELCSAVWTSQTRNGFAIIRPPGHHAEAEEAMGFCIYNNVAVAANFLREKHHARRILILDWDVHHGNGTQEAFYDTDEVLFISIHRYDNGSFYPHLEEANYTFIGKDEGTGFNINIPWPCAGFGDADYMHVFHHIVMPIAYEYQPDFVLVSCGFDAAVGDPIGGCKITPAGYSHMTYLLGTLASGRLVLALEGGYDLPAISIAATACARSLLGYPPEPFSGEGFKPSKECLRVTRDVISVLAPYWSCLAPFIVRPSQQLQPDFELVSNADSFPDHQKNVNQLIQVYRQRILSGEYEMMHVDRFSDGNSGELFLSKDAFSTKTVICFIHDAAYIRHDQNPVENVVTPDKSYMVDPCIPFLEASKKRNWGFFDWSTPYHAPINTSVPYSSLKEYRHLQRDDPKMRRAVDDTLLALFDRYIAGRPNQLQNVALIVSGFAAESVPLLVQKRDVESHLFAIIIIVRHDRTIPLCTGTDIPPSKLRWISQHMRIYAAADEEIGFEYNAPRAGSCVSTGNDGLPPSVITTQFFEDILNFIDKARIKRA